MITSQKSTADRHDGSGGGNVDRGAVKPLWILARKRPVTAMRSCRRQFPEKPGSGKIRASVRFAVAAAAVHQSGSNDSMPPTARDGTRMLSERALHALHALIALD
ncbi:MAG TPA: hypothetical protein VFE75_08890 [Rhodanobacter sp.]|nr:hypothetical protein [Rhodanobacter sp.]